MGKSDATRDSLTLSSWSRVPICCKTDSIRARKGEMQAKSKACRRHPPTRIRVLRNAITVPVDKDVQPRILVTEFNQHHIVE